MTLSPGLFNDPDLALLGQGHPRNVEASPSDWSSGVKFAKLFYFVTEKLVKIS
jgi:hypothetical protein